MAEKILIDTDPGIDDAFAILYAFKSPDFDVLGLTTVYGNASIEQTTHNARALVDMGGKPCPVAQGAADPLVIERRAFPAMVHGEDGFGGCSPAQVQAALSEHSAADFIIETVHANPGEVTLVPIGPLTNIAAALQQAPEIAGLVKGVSIMGGAANVNGNVTPAAEANIYDDPEAAESVFAAPWTVTMLGLDATHQVPLTRENVARLAAEGGANGRFLAAAAEQYFDFHADVVGLDFCHFHDPSALIAIIQPELFTRQKSSVRVVCGGFAAGKTIAKPVQRFTAQPGWDQRALVEVCTGADGAGVIAHYLEVMTA